MHRQILEPSLAHGVHARIIPHVGSRSTKSPELDIIDVGTGPILEDENQLMFGAVERALATVCLVPDAQVLQLGVDARQYGRLGLCLHGELQHLASDNPACIQIGRKAMFVEPVERWRENIKRVRALLNAIAQFSKSRKVSDQTLIDLNPGPAALRKTRIAGWSFIAAWTQMWLRAFRVRAVILYDPRTKRFHARLRGRPGLGSALALQLMTLACQSKGIAICSSCARPFPPKRRPIPTRESYCPKCGIHAAWRDLNAGTVKKLKATRSRAEHPTKTISRSTKASHLVNPKSVRIAIH